MTRREQLLNSFRDKEYRDLFVAANVRRGIAHQIRAMRSDRGWTQTELARRIGTAQETISLLENPSYGKLSITTLLRLASVFDVDLNVRFGRFTGLASQIAFMSPADLTIPGFDEDVANEANTESNRHSDTLLQQMLVVDSTSQIDPRIIAGNVCSFEPYVQRATSAKVDLSNTSTTTEGGAVYHARA